MLNLLGHCGPLTTKQVYTLTVVWRLVFGEDKFGAIQWDFPLGRTHTGRFNTASEMICIWNALFKCLKNPPATFHKLYHNMHSVGVMREWYGEDKIWLILQNLLPR